jgi:hypothetical protein
VLPHLPVVYSERAAGYSANAIAVWFLTRFREIGIKSASLHPRTRAGGRSSQRRRRRSREQAAACAIFGNLAGHASLATTQRYIAGDSAAKRNVIALI